VVSYDYLYSGGTKLSLPMPVAVRSKAQVFSRLIVGIKGLNPDEFMNVVCFVDSAL